MKANPGQARLGKREHHEITPKGHVDEHWSEWFDNLTISHDEDDNTILAGPVADQSARRGHPLLGLLALVPYAAGIFLLV